MYERHNRSTVGGLYLNLQFGGLYSNLQFGGLFLHQQLTILYFD